MFGAAAKNAECQTTTSGSLDGDFFDAKCMNEQQVGGAWPRPYNIAG